MGSGDDGRQSLTANVLDALFEGLQVVGFDERYLLVNDEALRQAGLTREAMVGRTMGQVYPGIEGTPVHAAIRRCLAERVSMRLDTEFDFPDGTKGFYELRCEPVPEGVAVLSVDVTERRRAEEARLQSEALFHAAFDQSAVGRVLTGVDGRLLKVNPRLAGWLGYEAAELEGVPFAQITHPDDQDASRELVRGLLAGERAAQRIEKRYLHRDGTALWAEVNVALVRGESGEPRFFVTDILDIADRKRAEEALRASDDRFRALFQNMAAASCLDEVVVEDGRVVDYRILDVNPSYEKITGLSRERVVGALASEIYGTTDIPFLDIYAGVARTGQPAAFESWFPPLERYLSVIASSPGPGLFSTVFSDVTDKTLAQAELRRLEWMLSARPASEAPAEGSSDIPSYGDLVELNRDGRILRTVGRETLLIIVHDFLDLMGTSSAIYESNGDYALGIFASGWCRRLDEASRALCGTRDNEEALASGVWHCHESCWTRCSRLAIERGETVDIECAGGLRLVAEPIRAGGEVVGAVNMGYGDPPRDPETRKKIAGEYGLSLDELEAQAALYDSRPPFIVEMAKTRLRASARLLGALVERGQAEEEMAGLLEGARAVLEGRDFTSSARAIFDTCKRLTGATGGYVALLGPSGEENEVLFLDAGGLPCTVDPSLPMPIRGLRARAYAERTVVWDNDFATSPWTGFLPPGHVPMTSVLFAPLVVGGTAVGLLGLANKPGGFTARDARVAGALGEMASVALDTSRTMGRLAESERRFRATLENVQLVAVSLDPRGTVTFCNDYFLNLVGWSRDEVEGRDWFELFIPEDVRDEVRRVFRECLEGGTYPLHHENPILTRGGALRTIVWNNTVLRDPSGLVVGTTSLGEDVTDGRRMAAERRRLEEQLRVSQRMEAVGRLAGGVAHDFNNLLSVILNYAAFAQEGLRQGDPLRDDLGQIRKAGERAAELTRQLLAFSRKQVLAPVVLDLNEVARDMERMLGRLIGEDIELALCLSPELGRIRADPGQIEQVIMNLAVNARDAMPDGGRLTVETAEVLLDEHYALAHPEVVPGPHVRLSVTDTGSGLDEEAREHLFEPFFTTKGVGKGTGLGLSTVYGIVAQSGGSITAYSEPGQGTCFKIYFPRLAGGDEPPVREVRDEEPRGGSETVLIVEDEDMVRSLAGRILRGAGYAVVSAANGGEALLVCEGHEGPIDLLVTDVVMPTMNGRQLADRLLSLRPGLRTLFMSGYTDEAIVRHGVLDPGVRFLAKPFRPPELLRAVREALDD